MNYTRLLKKGMSGSDVKYIQACLLGLKYNLGNGGADGIFGSKTEEAVKNYQRYHKDTSGKQLSVDGKVGQKSWGAIVRDYEATKGIHYTRLLKKGMSGADVKYMKDCLFALKYYASKITRISNEVFGGDTTTAVKLFQKNVKDTSGKALTVDGIIGKKTWDAIVRDYKAGKKHNGGSAPTPAPAPAPTHSEPLSEYKHISSKVKKAISNDLGKVSALRQSFIKELLWYAYDANQGGLVRGLYIFGANLYDSNLNVNYADDKEIDRAARIYPSYFTGGRKEWVHQQVARSKTIPASDCSGMIVGLMREHRVVSNTFDTTANSFCSNSYSTAIHSSQLMPGDWVGYNGHIGMYVGGGYVIEYAGGSMGCQVTSLNNRYVYDFVAQKLVKKKQWNKFRRPKLY